MMRWALDAADLIEITPIKARDLIVQCFCEAQKETFARTEQQMGQRPSDQDLGDMMTGAVRLAFRDAGFDFENPSKTALVKVVEVLARKSAARGTPHEIIAHHRQQIGMVLSALD
jgi:hypothetical protein